MSAEQLEKLNGVYIELSLDEEGNLAFGGGWEFEDGVDEDYIAYMQTLLRGMYAILSTQHDNVLVAGQMASVGAFMAAMEDEYDEDEDDDEMEIVFEPDEEFLEAVQKAQEAEQAQDNVVDISKMKFNPRKHRKH